MNWKAGLVLTIAGIWVITQLFQGGLAGKLAGQL